MCAHEEGRARIERLQLRPAKKGFLPLKAARTDCSGERGRVCVCVCVWWRILSSPPPRCGDPSTRPVRRYGGVYNANIIIIGATPGRHSATYGRRKNFRVKLKRCFFERPRRNLQKKKKPLRFRRFAVFFYFSIFFSNETIYR